MFSRTYNASLPLDPGPHTPAQAQRRDDLRHPNCQPAGEVARLPSTFRKYFLKLGVSSSCTGRLSFPCLFLVHRLQLHGDTTREFTVKSVAANAGMRSAMVRRVLKVLSDMPFSSMTWEWLGLTESSHVISFLSRGRVPSPVIAIRSGWFSGFLVFRTSVK